MAITVNIIEQYSIMGACVNWCHVFVHYLSGVLKNVLSSKAGDPHKQNPRSQYKWNTLGQHIYYQRIFTSAITKLFYYYNCILMNARLSAICYIFTLALCA